MGVLGLSITKQDAQRELDHQDNTYGPGFGVFTRLGEVEDEIEEDNGTLLDDGQDHRVDNRGYHQLTTASTLRNRIKISKLGGNTLQQRSQNVMNMTKKKQEQQDWKRRSHQRK